MSAVWIMAICDVSGLKDISLSVFTAITQGILVAGTSVYANQIYIQSKKEE